MKLTLGLFFALLIQLCVISPAFALEPEALKRLQAAFSIDDSLSRQSAIQSLQNQVVAAERGGVFVALWDGATDNQKAIVHRQLLAYTMQEKAIDILQYEPAKQRIANVVHSNDILLRRVLVNLYSMRLDVASVTVFLDDRDSEIRLHAIGLLSKMPGMQEILQQYIQKNKENKSRQESVEQAKFILKRQATKKE